MNIGFDYWQVISHYPKEIGFLIDIAVGEYRAARGYRPESVHVISAVGKDRAGSVADGVYKALRDGGMHNPELYIVPENIHEVLFKHPKESPELKLAKCKELGIDMFFDDREDVCRLLNQNGIVAFRVTRRDNSTYDLGAEQK